uniref:Uncharacterized protein n=1 Tax=Romanomermis culicivorax TaxID=13658 RepID=A0A915L4D4_ROMCU
QPQAISQPPQPAILPPPTAPVDVQTPQAPSTSVPALDRYARGLDNPSCLLQAYNTAVGLIDSWMAYPDYAPFPQPPELADVRKLYLQYHSETDRPAPVLRRHDFSARWNLLPPRPLPPTGTPSDKPSLIATQLPAPGNENETAAIRHETTVQRPTLVIAAATDHELLYSNFYFFFVFVVFF